MKRFERLAHLSSHKGSIAAWIGCIVFGVAVGCGDAITGPTDSALSSISSAGAPVARVDVQPWRDRLETGATLQLTAIARDGAGNPLTGRDIEWSSNKVDVATVSTDGLVTGVGPGLATITATAEGRSGYSAITVVGSVAAVASVTVSPDQASVAVGGTVQLTATAEGENGSVLAAQTYAWTSSNTSVATVSTTGVVTGAAIGTATITAAAGGKSASASVTVVSAGEVVDRVVVSPGQDTLATGEQLQLVAAAQDANRNELSGRTFEWTTNRPDVASVNGEGLVTGVGPGLATITATSEGHSGFAAITVAGSAAPTVASVTLSPDAASVQAGSTVQFTATARDESGDILPDQTFAWISNNTAIATVSANGVVTGVAAGTATITANTGGESGSATITVTTAPPPAVASVSVTPVAASVEEGSTVQLAATATDETGNVLSGRAFAWTTSNASVATVGTNGVVTGAAAGTATVTATTDNVSGTASITVTTVAPSVTAVTVLPNPASVEAGSTVQLTATARDEDGNTMSGQTFAWSSSNASVASVNSNGVVSGASAGTATITANTGGVTGTAIVTATSPPAPTVTSVTVLPNPASVEAGSTVQLTATARDEVGNTMSGQTFAWSSGNTSVASVNSNGVVSGTNAGTATITATTEGVSGIASVTVTVPPPTGTDNVLFFSDWRTARGNSMQAVTDGGKWSFVSAEYAETMDIVATTGLDFPTTNAYQVIATASRSGWSELRHTSLPVPTAGQSRFYRFYMRITMPDGLQDDQTHPVQDNYLENWGLIIYNGGGGGGVPNGMWRPEFWSLNSGWPNDRWRGPNLAKNQTYRIEMQVELTGTSTYRMHVRIYNSAGTLVVDDGDFSNNSNTALLSTNPTLMLGSVSALNGITAGNNGIGDNPTFPFTVSYQAGFAVCATTWCGAYNGSY